MPSLRLSHTNTLLVPALPASPAGHNTLREELLRLVRGGLAYALAEPPSRLSFAAWGLGHFTAKLAQEDASTLVQASTSGVGCNLFQFCLAGLGPWALHRQAGTGGRVYTCAGKYLVWGEG